MSFATPVKRESRQAGVLRSDSRCHLPGQCEHLPTKPWCAEHQERLDRVKLELALELGRKNNWGHEPLAATEF